MILASASHKAAKFSYDPNKSHNAGIA